MPNTSVAPCLACGVHTGNADLICSDECFEQYLNDNTDLYDADSVAEEYMGGDMMDEQDCEDNSYGEWEDTDDGRYDD